MYETFGVIVLAAVVARLAGLYHSHRAAVKELQAKLKATEQELLATKLTLDSYRLAETRRREATKYNIKDVTRA